MMQGIGDVSTSEKVLLDHPKKMWRNSAYTIAVDPNSGVLLFIMPIIGLTQSLVIGPSLSKLKFCDPSILICPDWILQLYQIQAMQTPPGQVWGTWIATDVTAVEFGGTSVVWLTILASPKNDRSKLGKFRMVSCVNYSLLVFVDGNNWPAFVSDLSHCEWLGVSLKRWHLESCKSSRMVP